MKEPIPFISTKLRVPAPRKDWIRRDRLFQKIAGMWHHKITVVKAVAGSGKTTLVSSFLQTNPFDGITKATYRWITLDQENNNVFSFWNYMLEALKDLIENDRESIESLFPIMMNKEEIERVIIVLINRLQNAGELAIILDDFHVIQDSTVNQTMEFLIKYSSDNLHFVLLTREEPKLYLSDLLMAGQLLEIQEEELKLTFEEGQQFLKETLKIKKSEEELEEMNQLAEGWIGGLQLIALASLQKSQPAYMPFHSLNKHLVEYLSKEILDTVSDWEKDFLIKTSVLPYFNDSIANELLSIQNGNDIIIQLQDKNLFIIQLDGSADQSISYRYHNLFGKFLQQQFSNLDAKTRRDVHRKAASIFEKYGDLDGCLHHLFAIGAYGEALSIVERLGQNPRGWFLLSQIPIEYMLENKEMMFQRLFYHYCNMEDAALHEIIEKISDKTKHDPAWKVFQSSISLIGENNFAIDTIPLSDIEAMHLSDVTKAILYLHITHFTALQGRYQDALQVLEQTQISKKQANNPYVQYYVLTLQAQILENIGALRKCLNIYEQILALVDEYPFLQSLTPNTYIGITGVHLKQASLTKAKESLELARQYMNRENAALELGYLFNVMELAYLQGKKQEAYEKLESFMNSGATSLHYWYMATLLKYYMYLNQVDDTKLDHFLNLHQSIDTKTPVRAEEKLVYAMALFYKGRKRESLEIVDSILEFTRKNKIRVLLIETILFKIRLLHEEDGVDTYSREILNLFREAIYYSYEDQIVSPYLFYEADRITDIVEAVKLEKEDDLNTKEKQFLEHLVQILQGRDTGTGIRNGKGNDTGHSDDNDDRNRIGAIEEALLTDRELEVLQVLVTGATNKQIAETLCISVATVKTHIIHIYTKLEVSNRVEALEKARSLKLC